MISVTNSLRVEGFVVSGFQRFQLLVLGDDADHDGGGSTWHGGQEAEREGLRTGYSHRDVPLPPARLDLSKFPLSLQIAPQAGDQAFKTGSFCGEDFICKL